MIQLDAGRANRIFNVRPPLMKPLRWAPPPARGFLQARACRWWRSGRSPAQRAPATGNSERLCPRSWVERNTVPVVARIRHRRRRYQSLHEANETEAGVGASPIHCSPVDDISPGPAGVSLRGAKRLNGSNGVPPSLTVSAAAAWAPPAETQLSGGVAGPSAGWRSMIGAAGTPWPWPRTAPCVRRGDWPR